MTDTSPPNSDETPVDPETTTSKKEGKKRGGCFGCFFKTALLGLLLLGICGIIAYTQRAKIIDAAKAPLVAQLAQRGVYAEVGDLTWAAGRGALIESLTLYREEQRIERIMTLSNVAFDPRVKAIASREGEMVRLTAENATLTVYTKGGSHEIAGVDAAITVGSDELVIEGANGYVGDLAVEIDGVFAVGDALQQSDDELSLDQAPRPKTPGAPKPEIAAAVPATPDEEEEPKLNFDFLDKVMPWLAVESLSEDEQVTLKVQLNRPPGLDTDLEVDGVISGTNFRWQGVDVSEVSAKARYVDDARIDGLVLTLPSGSLKADAHFSKESGEISVSNLSSDLDVLTLVRGFLDEEPAALANIRTLSNPALSSEQIVITPGKSGDAEDGSDRIPTSIVGVLTCAPTSSVGFRVGDEGQEVIMTEFGGAVEMTGTEYSAKAMSAGLAGGKVAIEQLGYDSAARVLTLNDARSEGADLVTLARSLSPSLNESLSIIRVRQTPSLHIPELSIPLGDSGAKLAGAVNIAEPISFDLVLGDDPQAPGLPVDGLNGAIFFEDGVIRGRKIGADLPGGALQTHFALDSEAGSLVLSNVRCNADVFDVLRGLNPDMVDSLEGFDFASAPDLISEELSIPLSDPQQLSGTLRFAGSGDLRIPMEHGEGEELRVEILAIDDLAGSFVLDGGKAITENLEGKILGGNLTGTGTYDFAAERQVFDGRLDVFDVEVKRLGVLLGNAEIFEKIGGNCLAGYWGTIVPSELGEWEGQGKLRASGTKVYSIPVLEPVVDLLGKILPGTTPAADVRLDFVFNEGVLSTDDIEIESSATELLGKADIDLVNQDVDVRASAHVRGALGILTDLLSEALEIRGQGPFDDIEWGLDALSGD